MPHTRHEVISLSWKKIMIFVIIFIFVLPKGMINAADFNWNEHASLKISIKTEDTIYEWEYDNPKSFEFEKGDQIVRGKEAKLSFESVLQHVDLTTDRLEDRMVEKLEKDLRTTIDRIEIYRRDQVYYLQTWLWTKEK